MDKRDFLHPGHAGLGVVAVSAFALASASIFGFDAVGTVQALLRAPGPAPGEERVLSVPREAQAIAGVFDAMGYRLEIVAATGVVPRVYLAALPEDMPELDDIDARKRLFVRIMLPLILERNETLAAERERLLALRERLDGGGRATIGEGLWLEKLAARHRGSPDNLDDLVRRVDVIPPSLVLAQTIEESGWGTSPFAIANNAMFGQRVYDPLPPDRALGRPDPDYRLEHFGSLAEAVAAYMRNLNSHPAYTGFRALRAEMREDGAAFDGHALAATLTRYSELGAHYTRKIQRLIVINALDRFDNAALTPGLTAQHVVPEV